jgi:hypothetical protein
LLGNNAINSWERETGLGVCHSFGLYKLSVPTYHLKKSDSSDSDSNINNKWDEEEVVIDEDCSSIATRVWDNATLTVKWLQRRLEEQQTQLPELKNIKISTAQALALFLDWNQNKIHGMIASTSVLSASCPKIQVLELGSGVGMLSISLAKIGAAVMATEYGSENVKHLQKNCENNGVLCSTMSSRSAVLIPGRVYCRELDWYTTAETLESLNVGHFNLIVVTDCSLTNRDSAGVLEMIHRYGTPGQTKAIVAICKEREGTPYFLARARTEFRSVRTVPESDYHPDYRSKRHSILLIDV